MWKFKVSFCGFLGFVAFAAACNGNDSAESSLEWYPSPHGVGDLVGAANHLSPEKVLEATALVTMGKVYSLAIETGPDTPAFGDRSYSLSLEEFDVGGPTLTTFYDDHLTTALGIGTQIDGLAHLGIDHTYYNGHRAEDIQGEQGVILLGIETVPPIVTRGVLLDMTKHFQVARLELGQPIDTQAILAASEAQGVEIERGDVVLVHTGWLSMADEDAEMFLAGEPGITVDAAQHLADLGVVAVGADSWGLEVLPGEPDKGIYEVHQTLLAKSGVYILENVQTRELAQDQAYEFLFVLGQPKFKGAVQAVVNPIAIR